MMMVINDDNLGTEMNEVMACMVLDELLGLEPLNWEEIILARIFRDVPTFPDPPTNSRDPPNEEDIVGKYRSNGYGSFDLIPVHLPNSPHHPIISLLNHKHTAMALNTSGPIYLAEINKAFESHLLFTHFDGPVFNWTLLNVRFVRNSNGSKTQELVGNAGESGSAVFAEGGLGLFGGWWGQGTGVYPLEPVEQNVKKHSETWYDKIAV